MELFWFVQVAIYSSFVEDNGKRRTNRRFQYLEAFNKNDATAIAERMPLTETHSGGVDYRRDCKVVARVFNSEGKAIYLTEFDLDLIAEAYTNPDAKTAV